MLFWCIFFSGSIRYSVIIGIIKVVIIWYSVVYFEIVSICLLFNCSVEKLNYVGVFIVLKEMGIEFKIRVKIIILKGEKLSLIKMGVVIVVGVLNFDVFLSINVNV